MSIFISHSHHDEAFVDMLCKAFVYHQVPVWRDKWQLGLGSPITNSVEKAVKKTENFCLVLSVNALASDWVKKELDLILAREEQGDKVLILPIIIDDCKIPASIDKIYADFRDEKNFETEFKKLLDAVADKYNLFSGKHTNNDISTYYSTEVSIYNNILEINLDIISEDKNSDYFILTKVLFIGNEHAKKQYENYKNDNTERDFICDIIGVCGRTSEIDKATVIIRGQEAGKKSFNIYSNTGGMAFEINITCKKIGPDNGKYVVFPVGKLFSLYND